MGDNFNTTTQKSLIADKHDSNREVMPYPTATNVLISINRVSRFAIQVSLEYRYENSCANQALVFSYRKAFLYLNVGRACFGKSYYFNQIFHRTRNPVNYGTMHRLSHLHVSSLSLQPRDNHDVRPNCGKSLITLIGYGPTRGCDVSREVAVDKTDHLT